MLFLKLLTLPKEMTEYFDLTKVRTDEYNGEPRIHLYLDEKDKAPDFGDASPCSHMRQLANSGNFGYARQ